MPGRLWSDHRLSQIPFRLPQSGNIAPMNIRPGSYDGNILVRMAGWLSMAWCIPVYSPCIWKGRWHLIEFFVATLALFDVCSYFGRKYGIWTSIGLGDRILELEQCFPITFLGFGPSTCFVKHRCLLESLLSFRHTVLLPVTHATIHRDGYNKEIHAKIL
jgi:hypothetical protein